MGSEDSLLEQENAELGTTGAKGVNGLEDI